MSPLTEKQQFRNESGGWLGVIIIGPKNEEKGVPVRPGDTIWLSEEEKALTANAPRKPEDNPFLEQEFVRTNPQTGGKEKVRITPLVPVSEMRFVPGSGRFVPDTNAAEVLDNRPPPAEAPAAQEPPADVPPEPERHGPPPAAAPHVPTPDATPEEIAAKAAAEEVVEETAAKSPGSQAEETGAAIEATGAAPTGEFKSGEEVGTPDAPAGQPAPWTGG